MNDRHFVVAYLISCGDWGVRVYDVSDEFNAETDDACDFGEVVMETTHTTFPTEQAAVTYGKGWSNLRGVKAES